ncbi:MAG: cob(I)yrinic acid a,c-diamide adenosyltransferase [Sphaerochaetaceae bacterium]|jgi:cob(I)alamin adenosyltransferase|nr:cob(I)yrinic acid a,c-diamide adenosyltransferase [Sphaerochaetaceae bacterium]MDX9809715.1 cob(I)yrinic acid a,c-diamide adenosyltransferase [Sphaerochaetaceae bacterium]NLV83417.1 cob(I)yrinic acid a,c-diamide adenosyltransferase [Spirochaetales bacterium]
MVARDTSRHPLLMVYTGNGKGKTSAALGLLLRCWGHGGHCAVAQFIKSSDLVTGERLAAQKLGVIWEQYGAGFTWNSANESENRRQVLLGWEQVKQWILSNQFDLIILDEFTYPLSLGYLDVQDTVAWLRGQLDNHTVSHIVITGRDAPDILMNSADLVSDVVEVKHHWKSSKIGAQQMVEY